MKVWTVVQMNYDESETLAVYADRQLAETHAEQQRTANDAIFDGRAWHEVYVEEDVVIGSVGSVDRILRAVYTWCAMAAACRRQVQEMWDPARQWPSQAPDEPEPMWSKFAPAD